MTPTHIVGLIGMGLLGLVSWYLARLLRARNPQDLGGVSQKWREEHHYSRDGY